MIDLHSHVLHDVDDGARTLEEAVEIARAAVAEGIEAMAATPHVRDDYPTSPDLMERRVAELREALGAEGVPLEILPGGEVAIDRLDGLSPDDLRRFGLGGNPAYLLVEFPYVGWPLVLPDTIFRLRTQGFIPVLAHPERNPEVQGNPARLRPLVDQGALVQLTSASLDGRIGRSSRAAGLELVELRLAHLIASDAHHPGIRAVGIGAAAEAVGDGDLARWLTRDVPAAIVAGDDLPERPESVRRGWFRRRLG